MAGDAEYWPGASCDRSWSSLKMASGRLSVGGPCAMSLYDEYMRNPEFARLMIQEDRLMEATEALCKKNPHTSRMRIFLLRIKLAIFDLIRWADRGHNLP
jgi:hypothetical protein